MQAPTISDLFSRWKTFAAYFGCYELKSSATNKVGFDSKSSCLMASLYEVSKYGKLSPEML